MRRDELIEKMARAMCERDGFAWEAASVHQTANGEEPEQQREYWRDKAEAAISAALSEQTQPVRVGIKPLEWHREPKKLFARSPFIQIFYEIRRFDMGQGRWKYKLEAFGSWLGPFFDLESEAKAAAQSDYETRIRSSLVDNSHASEEVETWRPIVERLCAALDAAETYVIDGVTNAKQQLEMNEPYPSRKPRFERELKEAREIYAEYQAARQAALSSLRPAGVGSATVSSGGDHG